MVHIITQTSLYCTTDLLRFMELPISWIIMMAFQSLLELYITEVISQRDPVFEVVKYEQLNDRVEASQAK